ncbi:SRPBCC family protein [Streptomyces venezuelae]|uniref:Uncharacterized protein n=1 Tax=Streptomyces venezuelae TaxID=54571 RepID=A0A5P2BZA5_STRVZ|nr:hypothetical protein DEJ48_17635 [Streptomyces venezuelae]
MPHPRTNFSGTVHVQVLAYEAGRTLGVRWMDPDPANFADCSLTRTLEHEGRGMRLFLVHEGFDPLAFARHAGSEQVLTSL